MTETPEEDVGLPSAAIEALRKGNKIEAIKILRRERNLGLKEAKDCVEDYVRRDPLLQRSLQENDSRSCVERKVGGGSCHHPSQGGARGVLSTIGARGRGGRADPGRGRGARCGPG